MKPSQTTQVDDPRLLALIRSAPRVRCSTHVDPDADGLGCCFALRDALRSLGKDCEVVLDGPVPASFWPVPADYDPAATVAPGDLLLVFDVTERERLGARFGESALAGVTVVNVDHHISNTRFGHENVIDVDASSSCEVALELIRALGASLSSAIAERLLLGLVFDTQGFHTSSTNARSLRSGADLLDAGGNLGEIIVRSYRSTPVHRMQLWGALAARGRQAGPVFWTVADQAMLGEFHAEAADLDGAINFLSTMGGLDALVVFKCLQPGETKVSVRSSASFDAAALCAEFGGGGHRRAAGCTLQGDHSAAIETFLAAVRARLGAATGTGAR